MSDAFAPAVTILATRIAALAGLLVCLSVPAPARDGAWPQFRGPGARAVADELGLPATWSKTENVEWVTAIPGLGWSSPVVWGGKVFLNGSTQVTKTDVMASNGVIHVINKVLIPSA